MANESGVDLKVKILGAGFIQNNDDYNLANISQRFDEFESVENLKKIIKKVQISMEEFGDIVFEGIRDENVFLIESHPKMTRIFASDQFIGINEEGKQNQNIFTKRFFKSILSKL